MVFDESVPYIRGEYIPPPVFVARLPPSISWGLANAKVVSYVRMLFEQEDVLIHGTIQKKSRRTHLLLFPSVDQCVCEETGRRGSTLA